MENIEGINYFEAVTNEKLVNLYRRCLFSRMELTNYTYPGEFFDEDGGYPEHFNRCEGILYELLYTTYDLKVSALWKEQNELEEQQSENEDFVEDEDIETDQISAEEQNELRIVAKEKRIEVVRLKMQELRPELGKLIEEYRSVATIVFADLRTDEDYENSDEENEI